MKKTHIYIRRSILFLLLLLPNLYALFQVNDLTASPVKSLVYLIVVIICLLLPALVFKTRTYFIAEGVLSLFCAPIEAASIFLNNETATKSFLSLVYFTDRQEAGELLASLWFVAIIILAIWIIYFLLASREEQEWLLPKVVQKTLLVIIPILLICGLTVFSVISYNINKEQTAQQILYEAFDKIKLKFYKIYPYNFYINSFSLFSDERDITRQEERLYDFSFGIEQQTDTTPTLVVLVIGETARSANFSLNGYTRKTNPRLELRNNIISCANVYSQANLTELSVPHILSRITANNHEALYTEKNVIEAFKEAGYADAWITNQTAITYTARNMRNADYVFSSTKGLSSVDNYDIDLMPYFNEALRTLPGNKRFICLHTMGNHWRYDSRYPDEFNIYKPATDYSFNLTNITVNSKQKLVNAYDNAILYTDFFLDSLISCISSLRYPALVLYLSDHGENLYDDENEIVLHGSYIGTRYEYNIPFIIWYSDEYAAAFPDKTEQIVKHKDLQFNSSVVFHTLLDAAGIIHVADSTKSLCHSAFTEADTMPALTGNETLVYITRDSILH